MAPNMLDSDIIICKFKHQSHYYIHFRTNTIVKGMTPLILPALGWIALLLLFYKDGFSIKTTHMGRYAIRQGNQT